MSTSIDIVFDRFTRTYLADEKIGCAITIKTKEPIKPKEVTCIIYCIRTIDQNGHDLSGFDGDMRKTPEKIVWQNPITLPKIPATIEDGFNFTFDFVVPKNSKMCESVRGKFISVDYFVEFTINRGFFSQALIETRMFFIVNPTTTKPTGDPVDLTVDQIDKKRSMGNKAQIKAHIHLDTPCACFSKPPSGYIEILEADQPIEAITVSYLRNEKITVEKGNPILLHSEKSRSYIAENDPPHNVVIPFNMEWVRIHISPDVETPAFSITTSLKVRITFFNGAYASATIPLRLYHDLPY